MAKLPGQSQRSMAIMWPRCRMVATRVETKRWSKYEMRMPSVAKRKQGSEYQTCHMPRKIAYLAQRWLARLCISQEIWGLPTTYPSLHANITRHWPSTSTILLLIHPMDCPISSFICQTYIRPGTVRHYSSAAFCNRHVPRQTFLDLPPLPNNSAHTFRQPFFSFMGTGLANLALCLA